MTFFLAVIVKDRNSETIFAIITISHYYFLKHSYLNIGNYKFKASSPLYSIFITEGTFLFFRSPCAANQKTQMLL